MLRWLDIALLTAIGTYVAVLSARLLIRVSRGESTGYDQVSLLPDSLRRWILDGKHDKQ